MPDRLRPKPSGHLISNHPHLPAAVDYADQDALRSLGAAELARLMEHCALWSAAMEEFHASLHTPAAKTIWNVLLKVEVDLVRIASGRLQREIERRGEPDAESATGAKSWMRIESPDRPDYSPLPAPRKRA